MTAILTCSPATRDYGRSDIARSVRFHGTDVSTIESRLAAQRLGPRPVVPVGQLLVGQLVVGGMFCGARALASHWITLLVLSTLALCLGGALTMAYSLGGMIVPVETRGAAFGWLALGVQIGTATSPLLTGFVAAVSLTNAYLMNALLALGGAALLVFGARDLLDRRERGEA